MKPTNRNVALATAAIASFVACAAGLCLTTAANAQTGITEEAAHAIGVDAYLDGRDAEAIHEH
jgi:hypothetical protein